VHHAVYLCFFAGCLRLHMSVAANTTYPLEITTVLLAAGHIWPALRFDWLFGFAFFGLRLVYHAYTLSIHYRWPAPTVTCWPFIASVLLLHSYWFYGWVKGMQRRARAAAKAAKAE
jgi:hypothetical protein